MVAADDAAVLLAAVDCDWMGETKPLTDDTDAATRAAAAYADCNLMIACISACLLRFASPSCTFYVDAWLYLLVDPSICHICHLDALPHDGQDVFRPIRKTGTR